MAETGRFNNDRIPQIIIRCGPTVTLESHPRSRGE